VTFGKTLEDAYWKTEILDAYCRILLLSKQLGRVTYLDERESFELLDLKKKLGFDDPRFHVENCDLCSTAPSAMATRKIIAAEGVRSTSCLSGVSRSTEGGYGNASQASGRFPSPTWKPW